MECIPAKEEVDRLVSAVISGVGDVQVMENMRELYQQVILDHVKNPETMVRLKIQTDLPAAIILYAVDHVDVYLTDQ